MPINAAAEGLSHMVGFLKENLNVNFIAPNTSFREVMMDKLAKTHPRIAAKDATTWGVTAQAEAAIRLNWVDLDESSRPLLPQLDALAAKFRERTDLILCGMGGSSLAPEVIAQTFKKKVFILDSTDPDYLAHALTGDASKLLILVELLMVLWDCIFKDKL